MIFFNVSWSEEPLVAFAHSKYIAMPLNPNIDPNSPQAILGDTKGATNEAVIGNSQYQVQSFTYPIDLGLNPALNHWVQFFIYEQNNTQAYTGRTVASDSGAQFVRNNPTGGPAGFIGPVLPSQSGAKSQSTINSIADNGVGTIQRNLTRVSSAIALYMPPEIKTTYRNNWGGSDTELLGNVKAIWQNNEIGKWAKAKETFKDFVATGIENFIKGADKITDLKVRDTASLVTGLQINPHAEVIYIGTEFRTFQFTWTFTPRSEKEAIIINNIIQAFKFYSSPEINTGSVGRFFIYPAEFDIQFYSNGIPNNFLNRISTCACTNVDVNYTGGVHMWAAYLQGDSNLNGVPIQCDMTLSFTELELITKRRVLEGF